ncbi:MAG: hypothetical protein RIR96_704 [Bacteroidota bacterium]
MIRFVWIGLISFVLNLHNLHAQRIYATAFYGASYYKGDLQERSLYFFQSRSAFSFGFNVEVTSRIFIKADFSTATLYASDRYNPKNRLRNLSFYSSVDEFSVVGEYNAFDMNEYAVTPFVYAGLGYLKFNPYEILPDGARVYLSELDTEGQGFYQDRKKYNLNTWCVPLGGGLQWRVSKKLRLAAQIGFRITGTDYIDDVSTTYVDKDLLQQKRGANAVAYAYRGDLLTGGQPYPAAGTPRGNPDDKDMYVFAGGSIRYLLQAHGNRKERKVQKDRHHMACPKL